jgi:hypothetical protein
MDDTGEVLAPTYEPRYLITFRDAAQVHLIRAFTDVASPAVGDPTSPFLARTDSTSISAISQGTSSRGIAVDDYKRRACDDREACAVDDDACFQACARIPLDIFVSNRAPPSLLVGRSIPNGNEIPRFSGDGMPLPAGPSRVVVGDVLGRDGERQPRVFVLCFDSRNIYVYDPESGREDPPIFTGRGPHAFVVDPRHGLGFVSHFTDSYIGVVQLDQRKPHYGEIIVTLGEPTPPRASK